MDSAKKLLDLIALASQGAQTASALYSNTRGTRRLRGYSLVRLEIELQAITNACKAILQILNDPFLSRQYRLDDRLMDWLSGTEPEACLATLEEMGKLLKLDRRVQPSSEFAPTEFACLGDETFDAAVTHFHASRAHFHFLLTTDIWNYETRILDRNLSVNAGDTPNEAVQDKPQLLSTATSCLVGEVEGRRRRESVSQKLHKLLQFLDGLDCAMKQKETASLRQSDTCMWLRSTTEYKSWRNGDDPFLLLQGKAGAGKSVLVSSVIEDLLNTKDEEEFLLYFYCDFRTKRSTSAVEVMRSILAQLISRICVVMADPEDLLDGLLKETNNHVESFYNVKGLAHHLSKIAKTCRRKPFIVVDAVDECREAETLLDGLIKGSGNAHIFATTRPLQNIIDMLSLFPCISMDIMGNELSTDILLHVTRELDSRPRLRTFDEMLKDEIKSRLCARAGGMFRWVQCQIDTLDQCTSVSEIRRVLESLPEGLEETYRRILIAIDRGFSDVRLVRRALVWLVTALRPMRMRELLEGLAIDPRWRALDPKFTLINGADLLDACRSLVVHHEETDIITLSHMSVKEYLVGELVRAKLPRYHIALEDTHEQLARLCMTYLAFCLEEMNEFKDRSSILMRERNLRLATSYGTRPLLKYVLSDGFNHLGHLGSGNEGIFQDIETLQVVIRRYPWEWDQMCRLVPSIRSGIPWPTSEHDFTIYILIAFVSDTLFQRYLSHTPLNPRDGTNPLVYTAQLGKTEHARLLISLGADVNHPGFVVDDMGANNADADGTRKDESDEDNLDADTKNSDVDNTNDRQAVPLEVAAENWHADMIDLLLEEGGIVPDKLLTRVLTKQPDESPLYIIRRSLQAAEFAEWVVTPWNSQLLLEAMVAREGEDLEQCEVRDLIICMQRLLDVGCARNLLGETILRIAVEKGCIYAVERLLSTHMTLPLDIICSALRGTFPERLEMVRLLIRHGADVNSLAINGDTPLHVAIRSCDEVQCLQVAHVLVEAGSDPSQLDIDDRPPIHLAVSRGFVTVVEYLLSKDVPLLRRILFATMQAPSAKRGEVIRLLVRKGASPHFLDDDTLLRVAMSSVDESDSLKIAKTIANAGYNSSACNIHNEDPLPLTVINKHLLSSLLSEDIFSALAYHPTREQIISFILGKAGAIWSTEENKYTWQDVIWRLTEKPDRCLRVAEVFVSLQRNLSSWNYDAVLTALFDNAVAHSSFSAMEYLFSQDIPLPPRILFSALSRVSRDVQSADEVVKMVSSLTAKGADVRVLGANGDNLLHVSVSILPTEIHCLRVVKTLIKAGFNPSALSAESDTSIQIAANRGFALVVEYLLSRDVFIRSNILFSVLVPQNASRIHTIWQVRLLVARGADVNAIASDGNSPMHFAMKSFEENECLQLTQVFAEAGFNLSTLNADGEAPIQLSVDREFFFVAEYLLSKGAPLPPDILLTVFDNRHNSIQRVFRIVAFLINKGADVHVRTANEDTPLHAALALQHQEPSGSYVTHPLLLEIVKLLVGAGGDAHACNALGKTPFNLAAALGDHEIERFLRYVAGEWPTITIPWARPVAHERIVSYLRNSPS